MAISVSPSQVSCGQYFEMENPWIFKVNNLNLLTISQQSMAIMKNKIQGFSSRDPIPKGF